MAKDYSVRIPNAKREGFDLFSVRYAERLLQKSTFRLGTGIGTCWKQMMIMIIIFIITMMVPLLVVLLQVVVKSEATTRMRRNKKKNAPMVE